MLASRTGHDPTCPNVPPTTPCGPRCPHPYAGHLILEHLCLQRLLVPESPTSSSSRQCVCQPGPADFGGAGRGPSAAASASSRSCTWHRREDASSLRCQAYRVYVCVCVCVHACMHACTHNEQLRGHVCCSGGRCFSQKTRPQRHLQPASRQKQVLKAIPSNRRSCWRPCSC